MPSLPSTTAPYFSGIGPRTAPLAGVIGLAGAALLAGPASAVSITQSLGVNLSGNSTQTFNYNQFDSSLGALTGVTFTFNGLSTGSFSLDSSSATLTQARERFTLAWNGVGGPGAPSLIPRNDITAAVSPEFPDYELTGTQIFTVNEGGDPYSLPLQAYNSFFGYFTGASTVSASLRKLLEITGTTSTTLTSDPSNLNFGGQNAFATLTYTYTPVPAPLPALGAVAGYSFLRRQRRRLKATK
jgi:hypothetical protein